MLPERNASDSYRARKIIEAEVDRPGRGEAADRDVRDQAKAAERSINVIFDLDAPGQTEALEGHRAAFGEDHCEVEELGDGKVVLTLYPGAARRLL